MIKSYDEYIDSIFENILSSYFKLLDNFNCTTIHSVQYLYSIIKPFLAFVLIRHSVHQSNGVLINERINVLDCIALVI